MAQPKEADRTKHFGLMGVHNVVEQPHWMVSDPDDRHRARSPAGKFARDAEEQSKRQAEHERQDRNAES